MPSPPPMRQQKFAASLLFSPDGEHCGTAVVTDTMQGRCPQCGEQELKKAFTKAFRIGIPWLRSFLKIDTGYSCPICKRTVRNSLQLMDDGGRYRARNLDGGDKPDDKPSIQYASFHFQGKAPNSRSLTLNYPSVPSDVDNSLLPTFEGTIQDGTVIDRFGDPDLMADHSAEYLRQFWVHNPMRRLPSSLTEFLPALLLLNTASELAIKAHLIRSDKQFEKGHSLLELYEELDSHHLQDIEARFNSTEICLQLSAQGSKVPKIREILSFYSQTYGGESNVHMDSRYYAEPTTLSFKKRSDPWSSLHGANLVKGNTPYPIFLPYIVRTIIDTYWSFSGAERLRRLGGDVVEGSKEPGNDNHGEWGLVPFSLGLICLVVSQANGKGMGGEEVESFAKFKEQYSTEVIFDWMYGGNTLLFYRAEDFCVPDGSIKIHGVQYEVWSDKRLGLHTRDLYLLADAMEAEREGENRFGNFLKLAT